MLPQFILDQFARIPHDTLFDNDYYGVFNNILTKVCFPDDVFTVHPCYPLPHAVEEPPIDLDSVAPYVVKVNNQPIFFLDIETPSNLDYISERVDADLHMRSMYRYLYDVTPTPRLHGVSVMGQRLVLYCLDKATARVNPKFVVPSSTYSIDTVPAERWDTDITTEEGYQRFMAVIDDVIQMAAAL
ncbi:hypothetical protein PAXINDRAFT_77441 [Paxillus involutus ATCC 200175]|uniref:Uncharacterized protein n=1 Tax=Paxillus involutus ATCC 200175 TaxID=664439 RepID=A0A0C9U7K7_PAXIN|nr:hypothetical protein PAXINDRAFT_77441 [Paxillus involutus ATCC 200175]